MDRIESKLLVAAEMRRKTEAEIYAVDHVLQAQEAALISARAIIDVMHTTTDCKSQAFRDLESKCWDHLLNACRFSGEAKAKANYCRERISVVAAYQDSIKALISNPSL